MKANSQAIGGIAGDARAFRQAAHPKGYSLIRVQAGEKRPIAKRWQNGEPLEVLLAGEPHENTGLLLAGLRAIDIDVDAKDVAFRVLQAVLTVAPKTQLVRCRQKSPRMALIYRAAEGKPRKRSIKGTFGGLDILGAGNHIVVDGVHPTGVRWYWRGDQSPATVPLAEIPTVTEDAIGKILELVAPIIGASSLSPTSASFTLAGNTNDADVDANAELGAGIDTDSGWFVTLPADRKAEAVKACLDLLNNTVNDSRQEWLPIVFAVADAGRLGCPDARGLALQWSQHGAGWTSEADFDQTWGSFRAGGITVGTLLKRAAAAGLDLAPWKNLVTLVTTPVSSNMRISGAVPLNTLPTVPPKREWLHGADAARGAVTLVVAPGGRGKSSLLTAMALALASGRSLLGAHIFGGQLSVLYLNMEDSTNEITLKFRAAMSHHGLTDADVPRLRVAGADRWGLALLVVERGETKLHADGWAALKAELDDAAPDVVIMDPLVSMAGGASLNDNTAAALLMGEFVRLAASRRCAVVVAHHTSKGRDIHSAEAAMGAASLTNLARIVLAVDTLTESDAPRLGVTPWDARSIFRVIGTKQNLSSADASDRWFRLVSVEIPNAAPPVYPNGDKVAVVEVFMPNPAGTPFPAAMVQAALAAIANAPVPLSPSTRAAGCYAVPVIATAIGPFRGGHATDSEAKALLGYLIKSGRVTQTTVAVPRPGKSPYSRFGLAVVGPLSAPPTANSSPP